MRSPIQLTAAVLLIASSLFAAEVIPPKPDRYFNDYAHVVSPAAALRFNEQLAQFERETSNQVVVAVFAKMQSDSDVTDFTQRIAQNWGVGTKERRNGVVLFVFIDDHKMFIQVGYGLEGTLPDATAFDITEFRIKPHFRTGDYEGGLAVGINSMLEAIRGEYKGSGKTIREQQRSSRTASPFVFLIVFVFVLMIIARATRRRGGYGYSGRGGGPIFIPMGFGGGGGGGWSSGSGGGFSGFSGGGGSFGGGGAGSSW